VLIEFTEWHLHLKTNLLQQVVAAFGSTAFEKRKAVKHSANSVALLSSVKVDQPVAFTYNTLDTLSFLRSYYRDSH